MLGSTSTSAKAMHSRKSPTKIIYRTLCEVRLETNRGMREVGKVKRAKRSKGLILVNLVSFSTR